MEFYLIMKALEEEKHLLQKKLYLHYVKLKKVNKINFFEILILFL